MRRLQKKDATLKHVGNRVCDLKNELIAAYTKIGRLQQTDRPIKTLVKQFTSYRDTQNLYHNDGDRPAYKDKFTQIWYHHGSYCQATVLRLGFNYRYESSGTIIWECRFGTEDKYQLHNNHGPARVELRNGIYTYWSKCLGLTRRQYSFGYLPTMFKIDSSGAVLAYEYFGWDHTMPDKVMVEHRDHDLKIIYKPKESCHIFTAAELLEGINSDRYV